MLNCAVRQCVFLCFHSLPDGSVSPAFDLVKKLIVKDPSGRLSAKQSLDFTTQLLSKM